LKHATFLKKDDQRGITIGEIIWKQFQIIILWTTEPFEITPFEITPCWNLLWIVFKGKYVFYIDHRSKMAKTIKYIWTQDLCWNYNVGAPKCSRGLFLERVWKGKPGKVTTSGRKRRSMRKIERHIHLTWSGWPIANGSITMRATTSWHAKLCLHIWIYKRITYCT
jgi:hypothetical protein